MSPELVFVFFCKPDLEKGTIILFQDKLSCLILWKLKKKFNEIWLKTLALHKTHVDRAFIP